MPRSKRALESRKRHSPKVGLRKIVKTPEKISDRAVEEMVETEVTVEKT